MSIGDSGRIVLEVDPQMKRHLYAALATDGSSLKAWFTKQANLYIEKSVNGQSHPNIESNKPKGKNAEDTARRATDASF
jgi:hypothetical protein